MLSEYSQGLLILPPNFTSQILVVFEILHFFYYFFNFSKNLDINFFLKYEKFKNFEDLNIFVGIDEDTLSGCKSCL